MQGDKDYWHGIAKIWDIWGIIQQDPRHTSIIVPTASCIENLHVCSISDQKMAHNPKMFLCGVFDNVASSRRLKEGVA